MFNIYDFLNIMSLILTFFDGILKVFTLKTVLIGNISGNIFSLDSLLYNLLHDQYLRERYIFYGFHAAVAGKCFT